MKYFLIAGEASGDLHASHLMSSLLKRDSEAQFRYFGGDNMRAVGGTMLRHYSTLAYMGFIEVIKHLPEILRGRSQCKDAIREFQPDVVILVDYPGFNLNIAAWVHKNMPRTKVVYYISPKIWAWKEYRIKQIRKNVDKMLCILPFEVEWYRQRGMEVEYVGNPTVDELSEVLSDPFDRDSFCQHHGCNANQNIIAILPGSRKAEVLGNLPIMLEALTTISCHQLIVCGAPGLNAGFYDEIIRRHQMVPPVRVVFGETYQVLRAAELAVVTSGTATLETAYIGCPQVVCYQLGGGKLFYNIMRYLLRHIRYVSLVNLILEGLPSPNRLDDPLPEPAVPELLGYKLTLKAIKHEVLSLNNRGAKCRLMLQQYQKMRHILGEPGAPEHAADSIMKMFNK